MNRKMVIRRRRRNRRAAKLLFLVCCLGCFLGGFQLHNIQTALAADNVSKSAVFSADTKESEDMSDSAQPVARQKYFTSISISAGDSLYGIAERYMSSEYDSMQDYIQEVRKINHISGDYIEQGKFLTVPYYK